VADLLGAPAVIDLRALGRRFGTDPPVDALIDVNLRIDSGEWVAIEGPSGSGKSTLLNILGCLDRHTSGNYLFDGIDVSGLDDRARAGLRSRRIGFIFQSYHLLGHRSVLENVMLAEVYRRQSRVGRRQRAMDALDVVGMTRRAEFTPTHLSGGERQRVAVARALLGSPSVLLADEPTGNLDSHATESLLDLLANLHGNGLTLILITHDRDVAARAQRRLHIVDGSLTEIR
jgi:macrolide transport system ATP-binding/permease protein